MTTKFEWDAGNAVLNRQKHGIRFETVLRAFADRNAFFEQDRIVDRELSWQATGLVDGRLLLLIAHTVREEGDSEVIRIISAREANRVERRRYEETNGSI